MPKSNTGTATANEELPTTYFSQSKKEEIKISEMNHHHLLSTLLKVAKEVEYPNPLMEKALKLELTNRLEQCPEWVHIFKFN